MLELDRAATRESARHTERSGMRPARDRGGGGFPGRPGRVDQEYAEPVIVSRAAMPVVRALEVALIVERRTRIQTQARGRETRQCDQYEESDERSLVCGDDHYEYRLLGSTVVSSSRRHLVRRGPLLSWRSRGGRIVATLT